MELGNIEKMESQNHSHPQNNGATFITTCFNGLNALTGIGLLSIPYAVSQGGWLSLTTLVGIAIICFYTALLLKKCMDSNPLIKSYPDIGEHAFGKKGRAVISVFMYVELFLLAVEFLILEGDNLQKLFPHTEVGVWGKTIGGKSLFIILTALVMLPTTWLRDLSLLAYVSAAGILASLILLATVFWIGAFEKVGFHEKGILWRYSGMPTAVSFFTFCYCGHAVFPTICTSMKDKSQFPKVLLVCFVLSSISYGSMAVLGYLMYGENLMSQVTLNLPLQNISSKIAIYTTLINPITKYAIIISPIATALEEKLIVNNNRRLSILIRTILVVSSVVIALIVPFFGYVMAFIGAFLSVSASILFPCLCYLKINKASRQLGFELMFLFIILIFGIFVAVTGTFVSVRDIVQHVATK
ncbi:amino acid transporter AVT1I-like [Salvia miltiorrhiza]|uniref:amino acid transporter AVT1I-like n=1 Tax=Salvia miltiorrhiza TaxID=226208 RepID=UPI0025AC2869|nr:amino acid transporter AVT1I-like [Salvia miltiorrhiza]